MFITVKYGEAEEALFNPNCRILHLLDDIKRRCKCTEEVLVDLSDVNGSVQNLADNQSCNATDFLKGRETFILVRVEKIEGVERPIYTPLLRDSDYVTSEFLESLSRMPTDMLEVSGRSSKHTRRGGSPKTGKKPSMVGGSLSNLKSPSTKTSRKISTSKR
ncbi:predicted protein [Nematostella vectensis]|uniref:Uncharacterized protein n=1 Tax=Nematostella vectensis TaxID=45351 RepID=A7RXB3_NEMVE|nr:predicted protein [Nematostella vectensis]|eukprot:XP_001635998.1 predicted protein [Nematostella vectensis]